MSTSKPWTGWITFGAILLLVTGAVNVVEGLVAVIQDEYVVLVDDDLYLVDVSGWGWVVLVFGLILVAAALGLFANQTWARIMAIVVVAVHAAAQVFWIGAYPIWSVLMIALDVVVLFALTARWPSSESEPDYQPTVAATRPAMTPTAATEVGPAAAANAPSAQAPSR